MGVRKGALNGEEMPKIRGNGGGMPMPYLFPSRLQSETFREHACINSRATPANRFCLIPSSDSRKRSLASQVPTLHSAQPRPEWTPLPGAPQTWNEVLCAMERNLPALQGGNSPPEENVLCSCFIHTRAALSSPGCCAAAATGQGMHGPWRTALPSVSEQASSKQAPASTAGLGTLQWRPISLVRSTSLLANQKKTEPWVPAHSCACLCYSKRLPRGSLCPERLSWPHHALNHPSFSNLTSHKLCITYGQLHGHFCFSLSEIHIT